MSHPVWVRGLKPRLNRIVGGSATSHPVWVRGLKPVGPVGLPKAGPSHPVWMRGLKLFEAVAFAAAFCRTPCGCVD